MSDCEYQTFPGNLEEPPEYCENGAIIGKDYCEDHAPWDDDEDTRLIVGREPND